MSTRRQVQTACQGCRKRRAKCSGGQPCNRCEQRGDPCQYQSREWVSKSNLRAELGRLRDSIGQSSMSQGQVPASSSGVTNETALQSWIDGVKSPELSSGKLRQPSDSVVFSSDSIPGGGGGGVPLGASFILASTAASSSSCFDQLLSWRSCHPTFQQRDLSKSPSSLTASGELSLPSAPLDAYSASMEIDGWTQIGWTRAHIRHLFDVLVTWDSICLCILRKKEFLQDYETGSHRFCSSALVHALLALATRLIDETENDSHILPSGWLGSNYFLRKANEMLQKQASTDSLPDIQALGILALYHIRCGKENEALKHAELCSERIQSLCLKETGVASIDEESVKVRATTYCGAISLRRMLYLITGVLFNGSEQSHEDYPILDQDSYDGAGTSMMSPGAINDATVSLQLTNPQILNIKMFQLTEWVHKVIITHQIASGPSQEAVLLTYTKCLGWYRDVFELIGNNGNRSPFILFIHMYYHFCLLCAFRPFVGTVFTDTEIQPHHMCTQAVQSILALAQSYDDLFTLRRVSALVPYFVCASGLFSLAVEDSGSNMDFVRHLSPRVTQEPQLPHADGAGPSSGTGSASRIKVSTVVQARILLSKMGESHPAAAMAAEKLNENLQTWRRARAARSSGA